MAMKFGSNGELLDVKKEMLKFSELKGWEMTILQYWLIRNFHLWKELRILAVFISYIF
jgi:hypothetical protein